MSRIPLTRKQTFEHVVRRVIEAYRNDEIPMLAAAISFHALVAFAPMIVLVVVAAGVLLREAQVRRTIIRSMEGALSPEVAAAIERSLDAWRPSNTESWVAGTLSVIALLWVATRLFATIRVALNRVWEVDTQRYGSFIALIMGRLWGLAVLLGAALLMALGFVIESGLQMAFDLNTDGWGWTLIELGLVGVLLTGSLIVIFRRLPDARVSFHQALRGALITAALMLIGTRLAGYYVEHASTASALGAAGSAFVLVIWLYYIAQSFLVGAEITWALRERPKP